MNVDVTMPQLGETVAEGTVTRWLRRVGDAVGNQEPLVEIATDKVDTEVPSPASGTLLEIRVPEDSTVAVGTVLGVIGQPDAADTSAPPCGDPGRVEFEPPFAAPAGGRRHHHSPLVRRVARESGVDLHALAGTGPAGRVTRADMARAAATGERTSTAAVGAPGPTALTCVVEVDVSGVVALIHRAAAVGGDRLTLTALAVDAMAQALRAHPPAGAAPSVAICLDTDGEVAVIRDAGHLNLRGLSRRIAEIVGGARTPDDTPTATFTVTDSAARGVLCETPILAPGQIGALAAGGVVERPVVVRRPDGERGVAIRSMAYLALTCDHRVIDRAHAARLLTSVKQRLEAGHPDGELT